MSSVLFTILSLTMCSNRISEHYSHDIENNNVFNIISDCGIVEIDENLNELKYLSIETIKSLLFFTYDKRPHIQVEGNFFFSTFSYVLPNLLK